MSRRAQRERPLLLVHSGSQLKAAAGFCFDPTACKASASTRAATVSSSALSRCGADMVGMLVPTWMQERRVSAPGLLVLLRSGSVGGTAGLPAEQERDELADRRS